MGSPARDTLTVRRGYISIILRNLRNSAALNLSTQFKKKKKKKSTSITWFQL